ncbi:unnamed protein product [Gadus morhua 'NCC']
MRGGTAGVGLGEDSTFHLFSPNQELKWANEEPRLSSTGSAYLSVWVFCRVWSDAVPLSLPEPDRVQGNKGSMDHATLTDMSRCTPVTLVPDLGPCETPGTQTAGGLVWKCQEEPHPSLCWTTGVGFKDDAAFGTDDMHACQACQA